MCSFFRQLHHLSFSLIISFLIQNDSSGKAGGSDSGIKCRWNTSWAGRKKIRTRTRIYCIYQHNSHVLLLYLLFLPLIFILFHSFLFYFYLIPFFLVLFLSYSILSCFIFILFHSFLSYFLSFLLFILYIISFLPFPLFLLLSTLLRLLVSQVGNDIRQVLHAMQMWRAKSRNMRYTELKDGMQRIEKDKVNHLLLTI